MSRDTTRETGATHESRRGTAHASHVGRTAAIRSARTMVCAACIGLLLASGLSAASQPTSAQHATSNARSTSAGHSVSRSKAPSASTRKSAQAPLVSNTEWSERRLTLPGIGTATAYVPVRPTTRVALFISGDGGWNLGVVDMARRFAPQAVVIGVSYPALRHSAAGAAAGGGARGAGAGCWYPAGDLERLSHAAQKQLGLPQYIPPVLIGYSSGATLVYAALTAAPPGTFAGAISLGFCPDLPSDRAVCSAGAWHPTYDLKQHAAWLPAAPVPRTWYVLHGIQDQVCALDETRRFLSSIPRARLAVIEGTGHGFSRPNRWGGAFDRAFEEIWHQTELASLNQAAPPPSSPLVQEIAGTLDRLQLPLQYRWAEHPRAALLFVSGDGGWASLDEGVAGALQAHRVSVVGISALRYFWQERSPDQVAHDLRAIVTSLDRLGVPVFVGGYSFGAAVVPVALARWPDADRRTLAGLALVTPGPSASFEIDPLDWVRTPRVNPATRIAPALRAMGLPTLCVIGTTEDPDECPTGRDSAAWLRVVRLPGSHHFHGDYAAVGKAIADFISGLAPRL